MRYDLEIKMPLEVSQICHECWGSKEIEKHKKIEGTRKSLVYREPCTKCNQTGYIDEVTDFGKEILEFVKRHLLTEKQELI